MPRMDRLPDWLGRDVFVVGGGRSLKQFQWERLVDKPVIGCNQAFLLGSAVCDICAFGDFLFWEQFGHELLNFGGWVVTNFDGSVHFPKWVRQFKRVDYGLGFYDTLAWNGNTGAMAVNLALSLHASNVYLLGFDMCFDSQSPTKESHWHDRRVEVPTKENYARFMRAFDDLAKEIQQHYKGRRVVNVTDGTSKLTCFPTASFADVGLGRMQESEHGEHLCRPVGHA